MESVCFVGHSQLVVTETLKKSVCDTINKLIVSGFTDFFVGGSYGFSLLCGEAILDARKANPGIRLHIIAPCSETEQVKKWKNPQDVKDYHDVLSKADTIFRCAKKYYDGCYKDRNIRLIEQASVCVCYYDADRKKYSGTGQAVKMAKKKGIDIINLFGLE